MKISRYFYIIKSWLKKENPQYQLDERFQIGILIGGQSNALGNTKKGKPFRKYRKPLNGVFIENNGHWETLEYKKNQKSYKTYTFGPELSLGYHLRKHLNSDIFIAKHAVSSAPIYDDPERINFNVESNQAYPELRDAGLALQEKIKSLDKIPLIIFIWIQGEGDAADDFGSSNYFNHFTEIYNKLEEDGVEINYTILNKLKIGKRWRDNVEVLGRYKQIQKQQQRWVELNDNSKIIDMEPFPFGKDELHFSAIGQMKIGKKLQEIITDQILPNIPYEILEFQDTEAN